MNRLIRLLDGIALGAAVAMLAVVALSVAGRGLFDLTGGALNLILPGAEELARYALLILVFAALPRAAVSGLISVDILARLLPGGPRRALGRIWDLLLSAFSGILTWLFGREALVTLSRGDTTQDLQVPLWIVYGAVTLFSLCLTLTGLWLAARRLRPQEPGKG